MPIVHATDVPETISNVTRPAGVPSDFLNIQATPASFGAYQGQQLEQFGSDLGRAANQFAERAIETQKIHNATVVSDANTQYQKTTTDDLFGTPDKPGYYSTKGKEAQYQHPIINQKLIDTEKRIMDGLQNDAQRLAFQQETRYQRRWMDRDIASHYQKEVTKAQDDSIASAHAIATDLAGKMYTDPERTRDALIKATARATHEGYGDVNKTERLRQKYSDDVYKSVVVGYMTQNDYAGAGRFLEEHGGKIADPDVLRVLNDSVHNKKISADVAAWYTTGQFPSPSRGAMGGGVFSAPPGPSIEGASESEGKILNEVSFRESTHNYAAIGPVITSGPYKGEQAYGRYGFLKSTWKEAAAATGQGREFETANLAPKAAQDANALWLYRTRGIGQWNASGPYPGAPGGGGGGRTAAYGTSRGIEPAFSTSIDLMIADAAKDGVILGRGSGFRMGPEQADLYRNHPAGGAPVAPPGSSQHEVGRATDLVGADGKPVAAGSKEDQWLTANQDKYRIERPVRGEAWHVQPTAGGGRPGISRTAAAQPLNLPQVPGFSESMRGPATTPANEPGGGGGDFTGDLAAEGPTLVRGGPLLRSAPPVFAGPAPTYSDPMKMQTYIPPPDAPPTPPPQPDASKPIRNFEQDMKDLARQYPNPYDLQKALEAHKDKINLENSYRTAEHNARVDASEKAYDEYADKLLKGDYAGVQLALEKGDPRLVPAAKITLMNLIDAEQRRNADKWEKTEGPGFWDVWQRIVSAQREGDRITDVNQIYEMAGGPGNWLTLKGAKELATLFTSKKTDQGFSDVYVRTQMLETAEARLKFTGLEHLGVKDPEGNMLFNRFVHEALPLIEKYKKGFPGQPPMTIQEITDLDKGPLKPVLDRLIRNPADIVKNWIDRTRGITGGATGAAPQGGFAPGAVYKHNPDGTFTPVQPGTVVPPAPQVPMAR